MHHRLVFLTQRLCPFISDTLGEGNFDDFSIMASRAAVRQAKIVTADGAGEIIDDLILISLEERRPVYLNLPTDLVNTKIPSAPLKKALGHPSLVLSAGDRELSGDTKTVVDQIASLYEKAKDPILLFDGFGARFGSVSTLVSSDFTLTRTDVSLFHFVRMQDACLQVVEALGIRYYLTMMGKAAMPERHKLCQFTFIPTLLPPYLFLPTADR